MTILEDTLNAFLSRSDIQGSLSVNGIALICQQLTGESPIVSNVNGVTTVDFSPTARKKLQGMFEGILTGSGAGGTLKVNVAPIVYPAVLKRLIPLLVICFALGYIVHRR